MGSSLALPTRHCNRPDVAMVAHLEHGSPVAVLVVRSGSSGYRRFAANAETEEMLEAAAG
jgi:hypothetical protein